MISQDKAGSKERTSRKKALWQKDLRKRFPDKALPSNFKTRPNMVEERGSDDIKTISELTDHVVKSTQQEFDVLELSLCLMKKEQYISKMQAIMSQKIISMFQTISKTIEDCSFGQVTTQVDSQHLHTLCVMYILTEKECNKILPVDMRQLFRCKNIKMEVEPTKLRLRLTAIIPGLAINYKALHIYTIPVFVEDKLNNKTRTLILRKTKIFETQDGYLSFEECPKLGGITLCDFREARSDDSLSCVKALINNHPAEAKDNCIIKTEYSSSRCYVKDTQRGYLVSSLDRVHDNSKIFERQSHSTGVSFIKKTQSTKNFVCGKKLIQFEAKEVGEIKIISHDVSLNLSRLMDSERIPYVERRASSLDRKIRNNSVLISDLVDNTNSKLLSTDLQLQRLNVKFPNNKTVHISVLTKLLFIGLAFAITIVLIHIIYKMFRKCYQKIVGHSDRRAHQDTVSMRRERLNRDTPSRYSFRRNRREGRTMEARL